MTTPNPRPELAQFAAWLRAALRARGYRPSRGTGLRAYAPHFGIGAAPLAKLLAGETRPSLATIERMAAYFGTTREAIEAMLPQDTPVAPQSIVYEATRRVVEIPVLSMRAGAGEGRTVVDTVTYLPSTATAPEHLIGIEVYGDCMEPAIRDGATVVVDQSQRWAPGKVVLVEHEEEFLLKRAVTRRNGGVVIRADNPAYPDELVVPEHEIRGVAIKVIGDL